jgi:hypothetical protein
MKRLRFRILRVAVLGALVIVFTGCSHTVKYKLGASDRWQGARLDKVVRVETFAEENAVYVEPKVTLNGKDTRTNARKGYKNKEIAKATSDMIAKHLTHSGLFKEVLQDDSKPANLVLRGTIKEYKSAATVNSTAEGVQAGTAGFGLVGALVGAASTSGMKSDVKIDLEIAPLTLTDAGGKVVWEGSIKTNKTFSAHFSASNTSAVYAHVDELLKESMNDLIKKIGTANLESKGDTGAR